MIRCVLLLLMAMVAAQEVSKSTMRKLCEMEEFQEALASDSELEPAAVVYEVMNSRLENLEEHIRHLEQRLETLPTQEDIEAVAAVLKMELLDHVDMQVNAVETGLEQNVETILRNLLGNLASLGYEHGYKAATTVLPETTTTDNPYKDCDYINAQGGTSGVQILSFEQTVVESFCDITEERAWLVIQRRVDDSVDFYRSWMEYAEGFGDLMSNFYFGNNKIHLVTSQRSHILRVELENVRGEQAYAEYSGFRLANESDGFRLVFDEFIGGNAGDALKTANGRQFSTHDNDRDNSLLYSCARLHKGAFWFDRCGSANLNGVYQRSRANSYNWQNIIWYPWKNDLKGMLRVEMKIRPQT